MLVFAMVAHEYAHAVTALQQGDDTAYSLGRVTLNPLPHIDPWMSLLLPALLFFGSHGQYTFGGAKPVPVNSRKFRHYRRGDIIVSAAGVTTNLFLSILFAGLFVLLGLTARSMPGAVTVVDTAQRMMVFGIYLNLLLCFFNLIPLPPLDGSWVASWGLPRPIGEQYDRIVEPYGQWILLALFATGLLGRAMSPFIRGLSSFLLQLAGFHH
jgi:Zn-dependent protease